MRKILDKWDRLKLGHKLHQLQKRYSRAVKNGYKLKAEGYERRIKQILEKLKNIK
jgi:ABC-type phosphate transport system auxiliary subunit